MLVPVMATVKLSNQHGYCLRCWLNNMLSIRNILQVGVMVEPISAKPWMSTLRACVEKRTYYSKHKST